MSSLRKIVPGKSVSCKFSFNKSIYWKKEFIRRKRIKIKRNLIHDFKEQEENCANYKYDAEKIAKAYATVVEKEIGSMAFELLMKKGRNLDTAMHKNDSIPFVWNSSTGYKIVKKLI